MDYFQNLLMQKKEKSQGRLGVLFNTTRNHYLYDLGTGKVAQLEDLGYDFLTRFFSEDVRFEEFHQFCDSHLMKGELLQFVQSLEAEHLLMANEVKSLDLVPPNKTYEDFVDGSVNQIILELTGKCNFRCKYCIYHDEYEFHRSFNSDDMSWDTAKRAIDYALGHSGEKVTISFYGGEPLIMYGLIKDAIDYSINNRGDKEVSFAFTTNLSLMTQEMAEYFGTISNLDIVVSIDGPEMIHDANRVNVSGQPTFREVMHGLELIANAFQGTSNTINVNTVFCPPYSYAKAEEIWGFFSKFPFLKKSNIRVTYPQEGTTSNIQADKVFLDDGIGLDSNVFMNKNPLGCWAWDTFIQTDDSIMANTFIVDLLMRIQQRRLTEEPSKSYSLNGCCLPGVHRLYVNTKGEYSICEKIGNSPQIGNVYDGFSLSRVEKYYINDYENASIRMCSNCWAANLCDICYAYCYDENGIDLEEKEKLCISTRNKLYAALCMYHELYEIKPERLEKLREREEM